MWKLFLVIPTCLIFCACSNAAQSNKAYNFSKENQLKSKPLENVTLPDSALAFIKAYFPNIQILEVKVKKSPSATGTFHEVILADRTEIDFGKLGNWIEVKAPDGIGLPTVFFPQSIQSYLKENYKGTAVESIDKSSKGYKLELTNDNKLYFDTKGKFLRKKK
ncbi:PepSY-like domain-containing protein [Sphingobacterium sp. BIGb0116]|uniref:PepSY-like domain-containing protein n=1 Tax=Sphingobacterium sp. BIGb0116 TaxID=2940619 RepID=UPI000F9F12B5|nr:PepSY-like domain-containing protein [Sphingobacterium sp. BIGb0116]MCS4165328.1 hypothetical protein [Sphingobacterium sp. BIGb0116]